MTPFLIAALAIMALAAAAFVVGAMLWLRRLRTQLSGSLRETLTRQINHGQKVEEALSFLQRNQKQMETQVGALADAQGRARADINLLREKLEQREISAESSAAQGRILH
ncbi:MAG TPA: hypothetical protein VHB73_01605 [Alphaproteobacteria bacterium]|nr:hypothetical protein [Alphaproteobacteria bacterium]